MEIMSHCIEIDADIHEIYSICADVEKWPDYFEPCKAVTLISDENNRQVLEITAKALDSEWTWQSERQLYPKVRRIDFEQSKPSPLVKYMKGTWRATDLTCGSLLSFDHVFEIKENVEGLVDGVHTKSEALEFLEKTINENTEKELNAIKRICETKRQKELETEFESYVDVKATAEEVYNLLYDIQNWPDLLPHCLKIEQLYEDGNNQEFLMTVDVKGKPEVMRSIRKGYPNKMLEYFQPSPPAVFEKHAGKWIITPLEEGVRLTSWHSIVISPKGVKELWGDISLQEALKTVATNVGNNSRITMETIRSKLEKRSKR